MKIEIIRCLQDNYSYLLIDEVEQTACVVDPSEAEPIINFLQKNKFVYGLTEINRKEISSS